ncbi:hypothetical protein F5051DRAFT_444776 [Lentinula edodes]|nr:hypothetical protein F5051DRAFT_444776 [Lentinula edodes]
MCRILPQTLILVLAAVEAVVESSDSITNPQLFDLYCSVKTFGICARICHEGLSNQLDSISLPQGTTGNIGSGVKSVGARAPARAKKSEEWTWFDHVAVTIVLAVLTGLSRIKRKFPSLDVLNESYAKLKKEFDKIEHTAHQREEGEITKKAKKKKRRNFTRNEDDMEVDDEGEEPTDDEDENEDENENASMVVDEEGQLPSSTKKNKLKPRKSQLNLEAFNVVYNEKIASRHCECFPPFQVVFLMLSSSDLSIIDTCPTQPFPKSLLVEKKYFDLETVILHLVANEGHRNSYRDWNTSHVHKKMRQ